MYKSNSVAVKTKDSLSFSDYLRESEKTIERAEAMMGDNPELAKGILMRLLAQHLKLLNGGLGAAILGQTN